MPKFRKVLLTIDIFGLALNLALITSGAATLGIANAVAIVGFGVSLICLLVAEFAR